MDLENNFIQTIINIFVDFINLDPDSLSSASIKSIVRPNNVLKCLFLELRGYGLDKTFD